MELVPRREWTMFTHLMIAHGRAVCQSRSPRCEACVLLSRCPEGARRVGGSIRHALGSRSAHCRTPDGRSLTGMDRLDLELYADRLARHADRLSDDLEAARLRLSWAALERDVRAALGARRSALLEAVGVLAGEATGDDDAALVARRRQQLGALEALQAHVELRIAELVGAT